MRTHVQDVSASTQRKRGRPAGKGRIPFSLDERRERNAQYERERRATTAEALAELAEAGNFDPRTTAADIMAHAVMFLRRSSQSATVWSVDALRRCNASLVTQIAALERLLPVGPEAGPPPLEPCRSKRRRENDDSQCLPSKRRCTLQMSASPMEELPLPSAARSVRESRDLVTWEGSSDAVSWVELMSDCSVSRLEDDGWLNKWSIDDLFLEYL